MSDCQTEGDSVSSFVRPLAGSRALRPRISRHASHRMNQRGIPNCVVEGLINFGQEQRVWGSATRWVFGKRGWKSFCRHMGREARHYDRYKSAYLIESDDGLVLTVAWQH